MNEFLKNALQDLADLYGARPVSDRAVSLWERSLEGIDRGEMVSVLEDWPKHHSKMPIPAEIVKAVSERVSYRVEEQARRNREDAEQSDPIARRADPATLRALKRWRIAHEKAKAVIPQNFWLVQAVANFRGLPPFCQKITANAFKRVPTDADIERAKSEYKRVMAEYDRILPDLGALIRWENAHGLPEPQPTPWMNKPQPQPVEDEGCPF